jgi:hypothetical protein
MTRISGIELFSLFPYVGSLFEVTYLIFPILLYPNVI